MQLIQRLRRRLAGSPLERALRALGVGRPLLALYERRALAQGRRQVSAFGFKLELLARTKSELTRVDMVGRDERELVERFLACLRRGDVVYDVGANIGVMAVLAARQLDQVGGGEVLAIEANPVTADTLGRNLSLNGVASVRARVHAAALGEAPGEGRLLIAGDCAEGKDRLMDATTTGVAASPDATQEAIRVPIERGDDVARETRSSPNVMKVDVEGAELRVMRGFAGHLAHGLPREVFIEVHPALMAVHGDSEQDLLTWMAEHGYRSVWCRPRGSEVHHQFVRAD